MSTASLFAANVNGQSFPVKPLRIVTSAIGGGNDFIARLIAQGLSAGTLGQSAVVDNRASGVIPGEVVAKAPADGYTLLVIGSSFLVTPLLQSVPYDPIRDFSPITLISTSPNIVVVHPSVPVRSIKELVALAKARPGELNYASTAPGSGSHLAGELFNSIAGVNIVRINYKSTGAALTNLIGGEVHLMFPSASSVTTHVKAGKLKALAVTSARPSPLVPGLPTVTASGLAGYEVASLDLMFVPAKTPAAIINRLNQEVVRVINTADVKQKFFDAGLETLGTSAEGAATAIKAEVALWDKVIKATGIRAE
jgi:tripartite-type tricarboxylate transporter receptor subunit TctC